MGWQTRTGGMLHGTMAVQVAAFCMNSEELECDYENDIISGTTGYVVHGSGKYVNNMFQV